MRQREARGRRELGPLRTQASKGTLRGFSYLAFVSISGRTVLFFDWPPTKQTANSRGMFGIEHSLAASSWLISPNFLHAQSDNPVIRSVTPITRWCFLAVESQTCLA